MDTNALRKVYIKSLGGLIPLGFRGGQEKMASTTNLGLIVSVKPAGTAGCSVNFSLISTRTGKPWEPCIATNGHTPRSRLWLLGDDGTRLSQDWTYPAAVFGNATFAELNPKVCYRLAVTELSDEPPANDHPAPAIVAAAVEPAAEPVIAAKPARKPRVKKAPAAAAV